MAGTRNRKDRGVDRNERRSASLPQLDRRGFLVSSAVLAAAAACGSDDESTPATTAGGTGTGSGSTGGAGGTGGSGSGGSGGGNPSTPRLQLPAGHFVPAKMSLEIVSPRPSDEIGPDSTYLWAHEGVRYEVPIGAIGGAWPFSYEVVDGPDGMTVVSDLVETGDHYERHANYGVVTYTPPAGSEGSTFSYTVRVTDQEGTVAEVSVSVTVQAAKFLFVAPDDGTPNGTGTLADPLRGFAAMYGGLSADATFAGRLCYFRDGAFDMVGGSDSNGNCRLGGATKPKVWRAFPDEEPVFDCSTAKVTFNGGDMDDCCFAGIRWENGRQDVANAHFIWASSGFDRGLFWRNTFYNLQRGQTGNDNPAAIFLSAPSNHRRHVVVMSNVFEQMGPGGGNGVAGYDSYALDYSLFENNEARDCTSSYCLWLKGGHRFTTVRGERASEGNSVGTVMLNVSLGMDGGTERSESVEVGYCSITTTSGSAVRFCWATTADQTGPLWIYRCTVLGPFRALNADTIDATVETCLLAVPTAEWPSGTGVTYDDTVEIAPGDLDASLALTGTARSSHLGTHGAEIA
ncbi:MAG: hypothetical protein JRI23_22680 [Deltaproteobacteria bacterium]|jgi:hypothetical protein|nr:hypothetical protein [Deltaproteobacteria bacterium]MBW2534774.1 hypothetical protein [Deltaproteobacteria bacterium]